MKWIHGHICPVDYPHSDFFTYKSHLSNPMSCEESVQGDLLSWFLFLFNICWGVRGFLSCPNWSKLGSFLKTCQLYFIDVRRINLIRYPTSVSHLDVKKVCRLLLLFSIELHIHLSTELSQVLYKWFVNNERNGHPSWSLLWYPFPFYRRGDFLEYNTIFIVLIILQRYSFYVWLRPSSNT